MQHVKNWQAIQNFGNKEVLKGLDLEIQDGSIFGLVGINGAGKSTLLRIIAGVYEPEQGCVLFNDCDTYDDPKIRKEIALFLTNNSTQLAQQSNL